MASEVTEWIERLRQGEEGALDELIPLLYAELCRIAHGRMRGERSDHTLSTTALVHEAYLKLRRERRVNVADRSQFLAAAGNTMRRILVDHARARTRKKRGGGRRPISLDDAEPLFDVAKAEEILALDDALSRLESANPRGVEVVVHRVFSGLTSDETAELLGVSSKTVQRSWVAARAWLRKEVAGFSEAL